MTRSEEGRFAGRIGVVTGASRGIGRAIALRLAAGGASLVLNGRNRATLDAAVAEVERLGAAAVPVVGSIEDHDLPDRLVAAAVDGFGVPDLIVNNAAVSAHYGPLMDVGRSDFDRTMLANTWAALATTQAAVRAGMGPGSVVNISTQGASRVHPMLGPYIASKAALEVLTEALAHELGPRGIRVNAVAPGVVRTDLARVLWEGDRGAAEERLVPLGRLGEPEDIASATCYLLDDDAAWITGIVVRVDGGRFHVGGGPADLIGFDR